MAFANILTERLGKVGIVTFNRPQALNALNAALIAEMNTALDQFEADAGVGCIILTGSDKAFAAGADIREMKDKTFEQVTRENFLSEWDHINTITKPIVAAVAGFALGGGCEFALACDIIIAADTAKFGLPETTLGIIPGGGGTQRLPRAAGKAIAMDMILTGRLLDANEAMLHGLVSRVVAAASLRQETLTIAARIADLSQPVVAAAKRAVNAAFELPLSEGLRHERRAIYQLFALEDQKEGMNAFLEKRPPVFRNR